LPPNFSAGSPSIRDPAFFLPQPLQAIPVLVLFLSPMPTYEYTCKKCSHSFEHLQSISSPPLATCPKEVCPKKTWGKGPLQRGIGGGSGLLFKGSGFYITDYRSDSYRSAASAASSSPSSNPSPSKPSTPPPQKTSPPPSSKPT